MTVVLNGDSTLCQCTFCADNCEGYLERTHQTTVATLLAGSHASVTM